MDCSEVLRFEEQNRRPLCHWCLPRHEDWSVFMEVKRRGGSYHQVTTMSYVLHVFFFRCRS